MTRGNENRHAIRPVDVGDDQIPVIARAGASGQNLLGIVKNNPSLFEVWKAYSRQFTLTPTLDPRLRELVVLRVACVASCEYEWVNHVLIARSLGVTDAEIARVRDEPTSPDWTDLERAALAVAEDFRRESIVEQTRWNLLASHLEDAVLVELVLLVGHYFTLALLCRSAAVPAETGDQPQ